jgi:hypothetical protein
VLNSLSKLVSTPTIYNKPRSIMPRHKHCRPSNRRAIQTALGQLGWHASGKDVVALLASHGIEVSEGLVSRVKVESLKRSEDVKRHEERVKKANKRRKRPMTQKKPQQRTYRR